MTNEERDLIIQFVSRTGGRPANAGFAVSVPQVGAAAMPPVDAQADALLADLFNAYPEARYRITQLAFVQEHALAAATSQIGQMQQQISQMQQQIAQLMQQLAQQQPGGPPTNSPWGTAAAPQPAPSRGLFGGLFGGGNQPAPPPQYAQPAYAPPPPQYAPGYQPGMFPRPGSGFLGSALTTAAGVAGGIMAADAITGLFAGHHEQQGVGFGGGFGGQPSYRDESNPWATAIPASDLYDQGGALKSAPVPDTGWSTPAADTGWQDAGSSDSGWSDSGGSDDSNS